MHNSTGFTPNRLVLGREVLAPVDVMYGSIDDEDQWEDYGAFVEDMGDRAVSAFTQVRWAVRQKEVSSTKTSTLSEVNLKKANGFGTSI